jgi:hypothetical protein
MSAFVQTCDTSCLCGGAPAEAPVAVDNRPGLSSISYRIGTWGTFRAAMIAGLSQSQYPQLAGLSTRDPGDFSIALLDAFASVGDVLTFYQERIANEAYLRTATERMSVGYLAGLIGYQPRPGVAASTYLAFNLDTSTGAPATSVIPSGTQVQSVPGAGQTSQIFETTTTIDARPAWNSLTPILTQMRLPAINDVSIYLQGTTTNINPGDGVLIVGGEKEGNPNSNAWDFRRVVSVAADAANNRTLVLFDHPLGSASSSPAQIAVRFFAFRQRAALWGHNAMDVNLAAKALAPSTSSSPTLPSPWAETPLKATGANAAVVQFDAVYPQIAPNAPQSSVSSWIVLTTVAVPVPPAAQSLNAWTELYEVTSVAEQSQSLFLLSGKCTTVGLSGPQINRFAPRWASAFVQSEEIAIAESPYRSPNDAGLPSTGLTLQAGMPSLLEGSLIELSQYVDGLSEGQPLIFTGKRAHIQLAYGVKANTLSLVPIDPAASPIPLSYMQVLEVMAPPVQQPGQTVVLSLQTLDGQSGTLTAQISQFQLVPAPATATTVSEMATLESASSYTDPTDGTSTTSLLLATALANSYDRTTVGINANVAPATHGATVNEVLGAGDGSQAFQTFTLKQSPLTFVPAANAVGAASTLIVSVNDVAWSGVGHLYGQSPSSRVHVTEIADDGTTTIEFGDGNNGARLPTGAQNVLATYRVGLGVAGNLPAGALTLLAARPLGVQAVTNPVPAAGGGDPELLADARANAGLTIQTLDRVVSLADYQSFAQAFAGVGKASADYVWDGSRRSVLITLAAADGSTIDPTATLAQTLISALGLAGDPWVSVLVASYRNVTFELGLSVAIEPDYANASSDVLAAVEAALRAAFSFAQRNFGQPVMFSEVVNVAQNVTGVLAVGIADFYRTDSPPAPNAPTVVSPGLPCAGAQPPIANTSPPQGAELLTLDPGPLLSLTVMS